MTLNAERLAAKIADRETRIANNEKFLEDSKAWIKPNHQRLIREAIANDTKDIREFKAQLALSKQETAAASS